MRFLMPDIARVGDAGEAVANPATAKYHVDPAVCVRDYGDRGTLANSLERFACTGQNLVPIGRILCVLDQCVADALIECVQLIQQVSVKRPPETVIDLAADQALVEFLLGTTLQCLPLLKAGMLFRRERRQQARAVRKEQRVTHVEEDETAIRHKSILPNVARGCPLVERLTMRPDDDVISGTQPF